MLTSILDDKITQKLVRIGSRSSDDRIKEYTLDKLEREGATQTRDRSFGKYFRAMKQLEDEMLKVMDSIQIPVLSLGEMLQYLEIHYPGHDINLQNPPYWVAQVFEGLRVEEQANGEFTTVQRKGKGKQQPVAKQEPLNLYIFWREGQDLAFVTPPVIAIKSKKGKQPAAPANAQIPESVAKFFEDLGFGGALPPVPLTDRSLDVLLRSPTLWAMSLSERKKLSSHWEAEIRSHAYDTHVANYEELRTDYKEACATYQQVKDEVGVLGFY